MNECNPEQNRKPSTTNYARKTNSTTTLQCNTIQNNTIQNNQNTNTDEIRFALYYVLGCIC